MNIDNLTVEDEVEPMMINDPICDSMKGEKVPKFYKTPIPPQATGQLQTLAHQQVNNWWLILTNSDFSLADLINTGFWLVDVLTGLDR